MDESKKNPIWQTNYNTDRLRHYHEREAQVSRAVFAVVLHKIGVTEQYVLDNEIEIKAIYNRLEALAQRISD